MSNSTLQGKGMLNVDVLTILLQRLLPVEVATIVVVVAAVIIVLDFTVRIVSVSHFRRSAVAGILRRLRRAIISVVEIVTGAFLAMVGIVLLADGFTASILGGISARLIILLIALVMIAVGFFTILFGCDTANTC